MLVQITLVIERTSIDDHRKLIIVFDDGGLPTYNPDWSGKLINFDFYQRLLELAEVHDLIIPLAVTASFIDVNNVSKVERINNYAEKLIDFLCVNSYRIPIWNHGLTHRYKTGYTEFSSYTDGDRVPETLQQKNLELSQEIFLDVGLGQPDVLVPPSHAWEAGVTDRLASELGFESIAIREYEKKRLMAWVKTPGKPYKATWKKSKYLKTLFRLGLGIPSNKNSYSAFSIWKSRQYMYAENTIHRLLIHRTIQKIHSPHHYFAHIQNLNSARSVLFWDVIIPLMREALLRDNKSG